VESGEQRSAASWKITRGWGEGADAAWGRVLRKTAESESGLTGGSRKAAISNIIMGWQRTIGREITRGNHWEDKKREIIFHVASHVPCYRMPIVMYQYKKRKRKKKKIQLEITTELYFFTARYRDPERRKERESGFRWSLGRSLANSARVAADAYRPRGKSGRIYFVGKSAYQYTLMRVIPRRFLSNA